ncbi:MAG TPA: AraC family transcriptional regulator, partial [Candidatus Latescibacteria bacterium]|nr:AraC family transcriptional regulator [Candidatus Latescibacterota bacterium]
IPPQRIVTRQSTDVIAVEHPDVLKAVVFIRNNLSRSIGADQLADALGCSRSRIDKLFAAEIGHSVTTEIQRQRISQVKMLLQNTDLPASLIAAKTGFCTPSHLSNVFRRETGLIPRKWRKN